MKRILIGILYIAATSFGLNQNDIRSQLDSHDGIAELQDSVYEINAPLQLKENERLIGKTNTIFRVSSKSWIHGVTVIPSATENIAVSSFTPTQDNNGLEVHLKTTPITPLNVGGKVILRGNSNVPPSEKLKGGHSVTQSLFAQIIGKSVDGLTVYLGSPLSFSIEGIPDNKTSSDIQLVILTNKASKGMIKHINFETDWDTPKVGFDFIMIPPLVWGFEIDSCSFFVSQIKYNDTEYNKSIGIQVEESSVDILNSKFSGFGLAAIKFTNTGFGSINHNHIENSDRFMMLTRTQELVVKNNVLRNGTKLSDGFGMLISADDFYKDGNGNWGYGDKSCHNSILRNDVDHVAYGNFGNESVNQAPTILAGIHLHRKSTRNTIAWNSSSHNGAGIYLETDNDDNLIQSNTCSNNNRELDDESDTTRPKNLYGVGIQLDWQNDRNVIDNNQCSNNSGLHAVGIYPDLSTMTGIGIEIRAGVYTEDGSKDNLRNLVTYNTCSNNGSMGLKISGTETIAEHNTIINNGTNLKYPERRSVLLDGKGIILRSNIIQGGGNWSPGGGLDAEKNLIPYHYTPIQATGENSQMVDNIIFCGYFADGCIHVEKTGAGNPSNGIKIQGNTIGGYASQLEYVVANQANNLEITSNQFMQSLNGWNGIRLTIPYYLKLTSLGSWFSFTTIYPLKEAVITGNTGNASVKKDYVLLN